MNPRRPSFFFLLLLAVVTGAVWAGSDTPAEEPVFVPDPPDPEKPRKDDGTLLELTGATWAGEGPDYSLQVQQITPEQRLRFIEHVTGLTTDPFAPRGDAPNPYLSFIVEVQNRGSAPLSFNPRRCWLLTNRKRDFQTPVGLSDLSFSYHRINQELPNAYQRVEPALLEDPTLIDPGDRLAGLLIFRQVHPKTKQLRLELAVDLPSGESVRRTARYARLLPPKKDEKDPEDPPGSE